jgi:hypothetical protein
MLERREHPRTPGRFQDALDVAYKTLRKHEGTEDDNIWRELAGEWKVYVQERNIDYIELHTITRKDWAVFKALGISMQSPWFVSSPND